MFVGSQNEFSSFKFHELCDNQGCTISVCQSDNGVIFGMYTSVPWQSSGGGKTVEGANSFLFKFLPDSIVKIAQKHNRSDVWHDSSQLFSNTCGFVIYNQAHKTENVGAISVELYEIPQEHHNIDRETYLAGKRKFKISEIEVFQVIS